MNQLLGTLVNKINHPYYYLQFHKKQFQPVKKRRVGFDPQGNTEIMLEDYPGESLARSSRPHKGIHHAVVQVIYWLTNQSTEKELFE
jgi:hypothetical protein